MEIRHLRYFVALAETMSFTKAAELVHISQSTLSHQIRQLEDELGTALFHRDTRGVVATASGESFLVHARQALKAVDSGIRSVQPDPASAHPSVRIGAPPTLAASIAAEAISSLLELETPVMAKLLDMSADEIRDGLTSDVIDIGLAYPPFNTEGLVAERLFMEELVLVMGPDNPLRKRRRVPLADLHGRRLVFPTRWYSIRSHLEELLQAAGAEPRIVAEIDNIAATLNLLKDSDAVAILPETAFPGPPWVQVPIERPFASREITLYRCKGRPLAPAAQAMRVQLVEAARRRLKRR